MRQEGQFALQADKAVTPILRLGDYPLVPDELRLFHTVDCRDVASFEGHLDHFTGPLTEPPPLPGKRIPASSIVFHRRKVVAFQIGKRRRKRGRNSFPVRGRAFYLPTGSKSPL